MVQCGDKQNEPSSESSEGPQWEYGDLVEFDDDDDSGSCISVFYYSIYCSPPYKMKEVRTHNWRETPANAIWK